ncbi:protein phosphatase 2C domain-containing protein [Myceligenerans indicum]|uniref:PPM-type phosphatase domain-containing protein n=1 Tax=Myceligenerans indicum TaxID=2593663 RepID=A0ABS1LSY3_9MICO|nr:protein phosphatase 2C domain-containing protein [Myceligenerans indicum]MBL0888602.1 hypothetical protein [Myceligenerans indicum]
MTQLQLLDSSSDKGEGDMDEDLAGGVGPYAWMFDGATDMPPTFRPDPRVTGAYWIAHFGDAWLRRHARDQRPSELLSGLAAAIGAELQAQGMPSGGLPPASSLAIVRAYGEQITAAVVGDVAVYNVAEDDLLLDPAFGVTERAAVAQRVPCGTDDTTVAAIIARRRTYLSDESPQWILGDNPTVGKAAPIRHWRTEPGNEMLLATDGFTRAVTDYGLVASWKDLADEVRADGARSMIERIRRFEAGANRARFFKRSDDACAALWRCA